MITNFRSYNLAMEFYRECKKLKVTDSVIRDQFERAVLSICLNLAEGYGKRTRPDRRKFFYTAFGSLRETQCLLEIMDNNVLIDKADVLAAHLYKLCQNT